jgi:hypothetical protein
MRRDRVSGWRANLGSQRKLAKAPDKAEDFQEAVGSLFYHNFATFC